MTCPFCEMAADEIVASSELSLAFFDRYPVGVGHTLIVPRRHVTSFFDLGEDEQHDLFDLMVRCKARLDAEYSPSGFNIGINDGPTAGQTIMHVHLHLIPRYDGDVADPRGGVRWIVPEKAEYWERDHDSE